MTNINVRVDETTKKQAEALFESLGLNMSSAVNVFLKAAVRQQGMPFDVKLEVPNAETVAAIEEAKEMLRTGKGKKYKDVQSLMEDLK